MAKKIKIGEISIDSGLVWIGDPCYILHKNQDEQPQDIGRTWEEFCQKLKGMNHAKQFEHFKGFSGLGVVASTGLGDGVYDVMAEIVDDPTWGHRVKSLSVKFF